MHHVLLGLIIAAVLLGVYCRTKEHWYMKGKREGVEIGLQLGRYEAGDDEDLPTG
jgi:hypothetical protein